MVEPVLVDSMEPKLVSGIWQRWEQGAECHAQTIFSK